MRARATTSMTIQMVTTKGRGYGFIRYREDLSLALGILILECSPQVPLGIPPWGQTHPTFFVSSCIPTPFRPTIHCGFVSASMVTLVITFLVMQPFNRHWMHSCIKQDTALSVFGRSRSRTFPERYSQRRTASRVARTTPKTVQYVRNPSRLVKSLSSCVAITGFMQTVSLRGCSRSLLVLSVDMILSSLFPPKTTNLLLPDHNDMLIFIVLNVHRLLSSLEKHSRLKILYPLALNRFMFTHPASISRLWNTLLGLMTGV